LLHLRVVVPGELADDVLELLNSEPAACNLIHLPDAARKPDGDVILVDLAREDASVVLADLRELKVDRHGSIAVEEVDFQLSERMERVVEIAPGSPADAVVWEEVTARTSETAELSWSFVLFMVLAGLIAAVGILLDSPILIVGAMVVGPEFGPLAGFSVAVVEMRRDLAKRSLKALAAGFPLGIAASFVAALVFKVTGIGPDAVSDATRPLTNFISDPNFFSFFVAYLAGTAGVLSLTSAKSGALIGVLISVTTIPAAANVGVAAAYAYWSEMWGALGQLGLNLAAINLAGIATLYLQRRVYMRRRRAHLDEAEPREAAGLPVGHSRRRRRAVRQDG
jgi:uncharacterized hydrophobic protein (TIGR00271 family)